MNLPDTSERGIVRVHARAERELEADGARLHLRIEGESYVFGNAALRQSREVAALVTVLKAQGLTDGDFAVVGVQLKASGGGLGRSSRASFTLELRVKVLDRLGEHLGTVSESKNVELLNLEWTFSGQDAVLDDLSAEAIAKAQARARAMARSVGLRVLGLRSASDSGELPRFEAQELGGQGAQMLMRSRSGALELGTEFQGRMKLEVSVVAEFWVGTVKSTTLLEV